MKAIFSAYHLRNLIKQENCFKKLVKPNCIDLILTNTQYTHQLWINFETKLIINIYQLCLDVDIWLKMKGKLTYVYWYCFNVEMRLCFLRRNIVIIILPALEVIPKIGFGVNLDSTLLQRWLLCWIKVGNVTLIQRWYHLDRRQRWLERWINVENMTLIQYWHHVDRCRIAVSATLFEITLRVCWVSLDLFKLLVL